MENFQRTRLKPMAYGLILASLAAAAIPTGQSILMPESTISPITPSQTTPQPERAPVSLDGMSLDTIPARPAIPDLPPAVIEVVA